MRTLYPVFLSLIISSYNGYAAEDLGDLDVTIHMMDSKQNVNEFINRIELPRGMVEKNAPPVTGQTPLKTEGSSKSRLRIEDNSSDHKDYRRTDDDQTKRSDPQMESPSSDRPSTADSAPEFSMDKSDRDIGSRETHENSREEQESSRETSHEDGD